MKIDCNNLLREYIRHKDEYMQAVSGVLESGWYVLGKNVEEFEKKFARYCGRKYCVGVASGLDALWISMRCLGIGKGDEVIVQANTYIASVMGITINGAKPVFVEPDDYYGIDTKKIEEKISDKTKAIMAVHLYGNPCEMDKIKNLCNKYNLYLIEDCAQSHGATYKGIMTGAFGDVGCFSFYPTKNLGAFGDGGCVVCDSDEIYNKIRTFRNYGSREKYKNELVGANSRLDELQAALLLVKLGYIEKINEERRIVAKRYQEGIRNKRINLPEERTEARCVYHQYVVRTHSKETRNALISFLKDKGISTMIHYPIPPHLSEAYEGMGFREGDFPITESMADTIISLPIFAGYTYEEQSYVIEKINEF